MRVVILDDDERQLRMFAKIVSNLRSQWQVEQMVADENLVEALIQGRSVVPETDLILLDYRLQHRDALELITPCREYAPVIIMSGTVDENIRSECLAKGASAVQVKPINLAQANDLLLTCAEVAGK